jgi:Bacterial Ig-like domain
MSRTPDHRDQELHDLLEGDAGLLLTAGQVREHLRPEDIDPAFRRQLRERVVQERAHAVEARRRGWRTRLREALRPRPVAVLAASTALALVAALLGAFFVPRLAARPPVAVTMSSAVAGVQALNPSSPITLHFDRPVDRRSVGEALRFTPATTVRTRWQGDDLVVTAVHGWVPNSSYSVSVDRSTARAADAAPLAGDLRLVFGTAPLAPAGDPGTPQGVAAAFAHAQVTSDQATMRSLAGSGVDVGRLPQPTRAAIVQVFPEAGGATRVAVRLTVDPSRGHPLPRTTDETLRLVTSPASGRPVVASASAGPVRNLSQGPHVVHVQPSASQSVVRVTYDCDMNPGSVPGTNLAWTSDGRRLPVKTSYDAATRTVVVTLRPDVHGTVRLTVTEGLQDVTGKHLSAPLTTTVALP